MILLQNIRSVGVDYRASGVETQAGFPPACMYVRRSRATLDWLRHDSSTGTPDDSEEFRQWSVSCDCSVRSFVFACLLMPDSGPSRQPCSFCLSQFGHARCRVQFVHMMQYRSTCRRTSRRHELLGACVHMCSPVGMLPRFVSNKFATSDRPLENDTRKKRIDTIEYCSVIKIYSLSRGS